MNDREVRFYFERRQATAEQLQAALDEVLAELKDPGSEAVEKAGAEGFDPTVLADAKATVEETSQGVAPFIVAILIAFATNAAYDATKSGWNAVIWPRVKRKLGGLALGDEIPEPKKRSGGKTGNKEQ